MSKPKIAPRELITLTFGDMAENHVGMEQIGKMVEVGEGFQLADLEQIKPRMEALGCTCELVNLAEGGENLPEAHVLVMRKGVNSLLSLRSKGLIHPWKQIDVFQEQTALEYDKQAFMYGRVVNKHARWNLCFDEESRAPSYEDGKGRIVGYKEVPRMALLKSAIEEMMGPKAMGLKVESNYYFDTNKCGIGYHGDGERRKVIGVRLGYSAMPMYWQWYYQGETVGEPVIIPLFPGDMYIMSEKAVGTDWKKKTIPTLRHATGAMKFTKNE